MTLPTSGPIAFSDINIELGLAGTTSANINQASYRTLAGIPSGAISLASFYGKSNVFTFTVFQQANADLRTLALAAGWNGTSAVAASINAGAFIYATGTGAPALTINGSWPNGVTLTNNGYIMGMGGAGGQCTGNYYGLQGFSGGPAISLGVSVTIINRSFIGGGGGGGAGSLAGAGGGGAGAGDGGPNSGLGLAGGAGGGLGSSGANGVAAYDSKGSFLGASGGGGGRVFPGSGGNSSLTFGLGGGAGGGGSGQGPYSAAPGGAGGSAGGGGGGGSTYSGQGAGGWGAAGAGSIYAGGGAGGKAIALNGFTATRTGAGTTYGVVS